MGIDRRIKALALAAAAMVCGAANAGTDTATLDVSASVAKACVVGTPTAMGFSTLALLDSEAGKVVTSGNADADGKFFTACTKGSTGVTYSFTGEAGADFALKSAAGDTIAYTLFSNAARTAPIARATAAAGGDFLGFAADGDNHELTVYGRIDLAANVAKPVGLYEDKVTITVSYD